MYSLSFNQHEPSYMNEGQPNEVKKASTVWLVLGFVFGILGGFLGILIGGHFAFGPYDKGTKTLGRVMMLVGLIGLLFWKIVNYS